jgi:hypothetical protein
MADEHLVLDGHTLTDESVTGDLASLANAHALLNLNESTYLGVIIYGTSIEIHESIDPDVIA